MTVKDRTSNKYSAASCLALAVLFQGQSQTQYPMSRLSSALSPPPRAPNIFFRAWALSCWSRIKRINYQPGLPLAIFRWQFEFRLRRSTTLTLAFGRLSKTMATRARCRQKGGLEDDADAGSHVVRPLAFLDTMQILVLAISEHVHHIPVEHVKGMLPLV